MDESLIYPLPARAWLDVSVRHLRHNAREISRASGAALIPMVKANAYGVGVRGVVAALEPLDPRAFGVATVAECEELRALGVTRDVIVFSPILREEFRRAAAARVIPTFGDEHAIAAWSATGLPYHLAIDTGMNRAGVSWRDVDSVRDAVLEWPPAGVVTHLHSAELEDGSAELQATRFADALSKLKLEGVGGDRLLLHLSNSAGAALGIVVSQPAGRAAVRPGIFLYGAGPELGLAMQPVVELRARVVELRWIEPGDSVSYDATYVATRRERIATVAAGYADGYPRSCSNRAWGSLNGTRVSQRGFVTMDLTMFDCTDVECEVGDVVTLIGAGVAGGPTVNELADVAGMSPYELLAGLGARLERRFIEGGEHEA